MLDLETTLRLIIEAQNGCDNAKNTLTVENMPLIISIVKRYKGRGAEYDDLIQLGSLGLLKAIMNFDVEFGVRFSTYAVPMIIGEIKRYLRDDGLVKVSRALKSLGAKIAKFSEEYKHKNSKEPTIDEIATEFGLDREEIVFAMDGNKYPISLYEKSSDDDITLIDKIAVNDGEQEFDKLMISELIEKLPEREKKLIILRYYRDKTQSEIASELGVSQVQVSRLEGKILEKLKGDY